jgi:WhiB family redox-sensing transcriptional regulator
MKRRHNVLLERPLTDTGRNIKWDQALCRGHAEPDRWYVDHIEKQRKITDAAIEQCNKCPIKKECLEYALTNKIRYGVYGGKTSRERANILRERNAA